MHSSARLTLTDAQTFADRVTDGERCPRVRGIWSYPLLAEAVGDPNAVAVYFEDSRMVYVVGDIVPYNVLVHELTHAVSACRGEGSGHGDPFVAEERELFGRYPAVNLVAIEPP